MCSTIPQPRKRRIASAVRHAIPASGRVGKSRKTRVRAKMRWVPRKITASGGPNAATYMW
jgi:hypothetical protein